MDTHTFRQQLAARRRELANRRRINHHTTHFGGYPRRIHDGAAPEEAEANVAADRTASLDGSVIAVTPTLVTPRQPPPPPPLPGYMSPTRCSVSRSTDDGPRQPLQYSPPRAATTCCGSPGGVRGSPGGVRGSPGGVRSPARAGGPPPPMSTEQHLRLMNCGAFRPLVSALVGDPLAKELADYLRPL